MEADGDRATKLDGLLASIYAEAIGVAGARSDAAPALVTDGFHPEQIWEQIELLNTPIEGAIASSLARPVGMKRQPVAENAGAAADRGSSSSDEPSASGETSRDAAEPAKPPSGDTGAEAVEEAGNSARSAGRSALPDDEDRPLTAAERAGYGDEEEIRYFLAEDIDEIVDFDFRDGGFQTLSKNRGGGDDDEDDEESIDMNAELNEGDAKDMRYEDFFAMPDPTLQGGRDNTEEFLPGDGAVSLSTYEKQKRAMSARVAEVEAKIVRPREWAMSGEVSAATRPEDALLGEDLEFSMAQRLPEPVTEEVTQELEELIRRRVIDENWDDVERKAAPGEGQRRRTRQRDVSAQKSEVGLGELYEREYVAKALGDDKHPDDAAADDKAAKAHAEIAALFADLNHKLDALSNFHFTPRPHVPELAVRTDAPAIQMEEVLPLAVSTEAGVAPEESFASAAQGLPAARAEMSQGERRTARRQKKARFRKRKRKREVDGRARARAEPDTAQTARRHYKEAAASSLVRAGDKADSNDYTNSSSVFARIQADVDGVGAAVPAAKQRRKRSARSTNLKL